MPSPIGHALAGMAVGWAVADPAVPVRRRAVEPVIFGAVAAAPDLDLLIGLHRMYVHSIGATVAVLIAAPYGLMALWPFSDGYYQSSLRLFDAVSRRYWLPQEFIWHNLAAALKEVAMIGPIALAAYALARWRRVRA
jgi:hypothetical protein